MQKSTKLMLSLSVILTLAALITLMPAGAERVTYSVTINGNYSSLAASGAGRYAPGDRVTIYSGGRHGHIFNGWSSPDGVSFANARNATTTFTMPARDVRINAGWIVDERDPLDRSWAWGHNIQTAIAAGLLPWSLQTDYRRPVTRLEFSTLAVILLETLQGYEISPHRVLFSDTSDLYALKAAEAGIIQGIGNNRFNPHAEMTREQAAVAISRLAEALGREWPEQETSFADQDSISDWAVRAVAQVNAAGIMGGVGNNMFAPLERITREQSIIALMRVYDGR